MTKIFEQENSKLDYKSLKKAIGKSVNLTDLAKTCVCFANAQGGYIVIGVEDKDRLSLTAQYIVYDDNEEKIRKVEWTHNDLNPKELLLDIEAKTVELNYSYELPNGLFRKKIRHYPREVIREILVNAFVHKSFTISGDIFINAYQGRLEIKNPGGLPLGITKDNILHQVQRRNPHLIETFKALMLMESEGSGYDLIYEKLGQDAKEYPKIESDINHTSVTIFSNIVDTEILSIVDYLSQHYRLMQKEIIALSAIARHKKISTFELSKILQLTNDDRLRDWIGKLIEKKIIITEGKTKGTMYQINPELLSAMTQNIKPSLKTMEEHKVKALVIEDLKIHPKSKMAEIHARFDEFPIEYIRRVVYKLVKDGNVEPFGEKKNKTYSMANKK